MMHAKIKGSNLLYITLLLILFTASESTAQVPFAGNGHDGPLNPNAVDVFINTDDGSLTYGTDPATFPGSIQPEGTIYDFSSIDIAAGITVFITGSNPVILLSLGDARIDGVINISAETGADGEVGTFGGGGAGGGGGGGGGAILISSGTVVEVGPAGRILAAGGNGSAGGRTLPGRRRHILVSRQEEPSPIQKGPGTGGGSGGTGNGGKGGGAGNGGGGGGGGGAGDIAGGGGGGGGCEDGGGGGGGAGRGSYGGAPGTTPHGSGYNGGWGGNNTDWCACYPDSCYLSCDNDGGDGGDGGSNYENGHAGNRWGGDGGDGTDDCGDKAFTDGGSGGCAMIEHGGFAYTVCAGNGGGGGEDYWLSGEDGEKGGKGDLGCGGGGGGGGGDGSPQGSGGSGGGGGPGGQINRNNLVENGDFEDGAGDCDGDRCPDYWSKHETRSEEASDLLASAMNGPSASGSQCWYFSRSDDLLTGDWTSIYQDLDIDLNEATELVLRLDVIVTDHNLQAGGTVDPAFEWPAFVMLSYERADGTTRTWMHGWYLSSPGDGARTVDPDPYGGEYKDTQIQEDSWYQASFDLLNELPDATRLTYIRVGGSGWSYTCLIDNVFITIQTPEIDHGDDGGPGGGGGGGFVGLIGQAGLANDLVTGVDLEPGSLISVRGGVSPDPSANGTLGEILIGGGIPATALDDYGFGDGLRGVITQLPDALPGPEFVLVGGGGGGGGGGAGNMVSDTAVRDALSDRPQLLGIKPNPFNPATTISFFAPGAGSAAIRIYDLKGRRVWQTVETATGESIIDVEWDGCNFDGARVASGTYLVKFEMFGIKDVRKITLAK